MATQTVRALEIAFEPLYMWEGIEAESATHKKGAVLVFTNGQVVEAGAAPTAIVGLAAADGLNKTGTANVKAVQFTPLLPGTIIEGNYVNGAAGVTQVASGVAIGKLATLIKRTAESDVPWAFDATNVLTAAANVRIVGLKDASGDISARVYAVVLASRCAFTGGF